MSVGYQFRYESSINEKTTISRLRKRIVRYPRHRLLLYYVPVTSYRIDLLVENLVIVEKSIENPAPVHFAQTST